MTGPVTGHLDLDALADAVAGEGDDATVTHLASCPACRTALSEVQAASEQVTGELRALPPVPMPDDVVRRLRTQPSAVTTLPAGGPTGQPTRWQRLLPAAAAVVLLIAGGGYAISRLASGGGSGDNAGSTAGGSIAKAAPTEGFPRSSTGSDYTGRDDLARAAPMLVSGADAPRAMAQSGASTAAGTRAADSLARLRTPAGLAECLLALLPPDDPSVRPLALDYASFRGRPAMVVLLPAVDPSKLDVYVVGPGCSRANDSTLFYTSVARP